MTLKFPRAAYLAKDVMGVFLRMITKWQLLGTLSAMS